MATPLKNEDERPDAEGLRQRAEQAIAKGAAPAVGSDPAVLLHELQVHQLELEMQNESLRQSQAETEAARQRLEILNAYLEERVLARTTELSAARNAAVAANSAKSDFLARMSHELRTPLNGIIGMTELARRRATDPRQSEQLEKGLQSGRQLLGLIETLIDLSDGEAGRIKLEPAPFPVVRSLDEVIVEMAGPARIAGMTISLEVDPSVPATLVGDAVRIKQLLRIFIGNAIKFAQRGRITVGARMRENGPSGRLLRLEVSDEGDLIAVSQRDRLFEPFNQADESLTRRHGGAGVGLTVTRHLARLMGGEAGVTGEEGKGNTFWAEMRLPGADGH